MSTLTIDPYQFVKRLKIAGFTDRQADEIAPRGLIKHKAGKARINKI